jgi:hypothetical protein
MLVQLRHVSLAQTLLAGAYTNKAQYWLLCYVLVAPSLAGDSACTRVSRYTSTLLLCKRICAAAQTTDSTQITVTKTLNTAEDRNSMMTNTSVIHFSSDLCSLSVCAPVLQCKPFLLDWLALKRKLQGEPTIANS